MIWHIFRKDWALLWPFVILVAGLQFVNAATWVQIQMSPFEFLRLEQTGLVTLAMVFFAMVMLIVATVHQDAIPSVRQDWLTRPIRRRDLLIAKLLFVLIAVHGPMFLANLVQVAATGFDLGDAFSAALWRGIYVLLAVSLPMLAVATMTRTLVEFVANILTIGLVYFVILLIASALFPTAFPVYSSGMDWLPGMWGALWLVAVLVGAAVIIPLQYFRRATVRARHIALGALLLAQLSMFTPWAPAFSFQQLLSDDPAAAKAIAIGFDPSLGKAAQQLECLIRPSVSLSMQMTCEASGSGKSVYVPLRVLGLPPESFVQTDRADVRIVGPDGATLFHGHATRDPQIKGNRGVPRAMLGDFPVRTAAGGDVRAHQRIDLPVNIYKLVRTQKVRIELDYDLTLFRLQAANSVAAVNSDKRMATFGRCRTRIDDDGRTVQLSCLKIGEGSRCIIATLEHPRTGQRNPLSYGCRTNPRYWPFNAQVPFDLFAFIDWTSEKLDFRDPQGLVKYPVGGAQIADAQVALKSYRPVAHFRRHLVIPAVRLGDWEAAAGQTVANGAP